MYQAGPLSFFVSTVQPLYSTPRTQIPQVQKSVEIRSDFTGALPGETRTANYPHQVYDSVWSKTQPTPASSPKLVSHIEEMTQMLGVDTNEPEIAARFTGSMLDDTQVPYSTRYGGHQFGNWAGQLGDGRAISLGEVTDKQGQQWTLQLKGAGPTPYSRQGDGFAVLRSSIREYMCAEAVHHLGIPTTRSLTLCTTGETIPRDVFYDGNVTMEQGAIVCRAAHSFVRFGNFEIHAACQEPALIKQLADYVISRNYSHLGKPGPDVYQQWFREILQATANDPTWTPNFVDNSMRRYCYRNQPEIALWNLYRLANALVPIFETTEPLEEVLGEYRAEYDKQWSKMLADKLGLSDYKASDKELCDSLWSTLSLTGTDFTVFFRQLAKIETGMDQSQIRSLILPSIYTEKDYNADIEDGFMQWIGDWQARVSAEDTAQRVKKMQAANPKFVLRNYLALNAIDAAEQGDFSVMEDMMRVLRTPYAEHPDSEKYAVKRPDWATSKPGCTMLTCSS